MNANEARAKTATATATQAGVVAIDERIAEVTEMGYYQCTVRVLNSMVDHDGSTKGVISHFKAQGYNIAPIQFCGDSYLSISWSGLS